MSGFGFLQFVMGLALLLGGAEALVRGATRLASVLRVSPLLIGLTVVAFGTSSPELAASLASARQGSGDIALGNVVGSNIFNVLFILGVAALIRPLGVHRKLVRLDVPIMVGVAALLLVLGTDGSVGRREGAALVLLLVAYLAFLIRQARSEGIATVETPAAPPSRLGVAALAALAGLAMLTVGATWLVDGASTLARAMGVSDLVIGLTLVAAGTSLPEVATSVVASVRGQRDLAVGNVVGSNIFNALGVLGLAAATSPTGVAVSQHARLFDVPVMLAASVACIPVFFSRLEIDRLEGGLFLFIYGFYLWQLFAASGGEAAGSPVAIVAALSAGVAILACLQVRGRRRTPSKTL